jgi:nucleoside-diphosphate-sugar epimerase
MMELVAQLTIGRVDLIDFGLMPNRAWEPPMICGDNRRLRSTGWSPRFSLVEGLRDTVQWWQKQGAD